jgi:monoamine oxidase
MKDHRGPDISFQQFLDEDEQIDERTRRRALSYVMGFHGADPREASIASLAVDTRAGEEIEGDKTFRLRRGYAALVDLLRDECERMGVRFYFRHAVELVDWSKAGVRVEANHLGGRAELDADIAVITLPLGVLRMRSGESGHVEFVPSLREKAAALSGLASGRVVRISLLFSDVFWSDKKFVSRSDLANLQFLFSDDPWFPTWWTLEPKRVPTLTGWSPALNSEQFAGQTLEFIRDKALQTLSRLLNVSAAELEKKLLHAYSHDWVTDPFSRGAYSYARVGGANCFHELAQPLGEKLYFAGEATEFHGHHATVHGAISSGERVANEIARDLAATGRLQRSA